MNSDQEIYIKQNEGGGNSPAFKKPNPGNKKKKIIIWGLIAVIIIAAIVVVAYKITKNSRKGNQIEVNNNADAPKSYPLANEGDVSPISGLACENWNRRPIAVMQPSDEAARPASGFSQADMVIEMPVITASITRLMGIYICNSPEEIGSMRSARHDFIHLAKGFDSVFVHWGRSEAHGDDKVGLAQGILDSGAIENMNCNGDAGASAAGYCFRHPDLVGMHSGYVKFDKILEFAKDHNYSMENTFSGYAHQGEAPIEDRPDSGNLRVGFAGVYGVNYEYDKESNSYLRTWGGKEDTDRNNGERIAPKNIVVMIAKSEQIEGQYNNVQLGDPWYDESDSGEAHYYMNGQEMVGTWKKDKSSIDSKLLFLDSNGNNIKFVPGQIWVEILEPGQGLKWRMGEAIDASTQESVSQESNNITQ